MACPHVSGVLALGKALDPQASPDKLKNCLLTTATIIDSLQTSPKLGKLGAGMVDAAAFLQCMLPSPPANVPPQASFGYSCTDLVCTFSDQSSDSDGTVSSRSWEFGDGFGSSAQASPTHTYPAAGTYMVSLTVTDNDGASNTASQSVSVTALPPPPTTTVPPPPADCSSITDRGSCNADINCYWGNRKRKPTNKTGRWTRCYNVSVCPWTSCK